MTYFIVKFRYKGKVNNRWCKWQTWHGKETYETQEQAILEANRALAYLKQELATASSISIEVEKIETTTIDAVEVEL